MNLISSFFAELEFRHIMAIVMPLAGMTVGCIIAVFGMYFHNRNREMWHTTARVALERGQPLPPLPEGDEPAEGSRNAREGRNDIRSGLILIAVSAGLYLFLSALISRQLAYVSAIPGFIGVALLICGIFSVKRNDPPKP